MVLIPLRSPLVSLCITIISVICELAFLTAALSFLRYRACRRLQKGKRVRVRSQHKLVLGVTLFAMLAFVTLETVTSVFSDPQRRETAIVQPCVRNVFGGTDFQGSIEGEAIHFACTKIDNKTLRHFEGNFSRPSSQTACSSRPMYSYTIGVMTKRPVAGAVRACEYKSCAFASLSDDNTTVFIGGPYPPNAQDIDYLPTTIDPEDAKLLNLTFVAANASFGYANSISEEGEVRRRALLGSVNGDCPFVRDDGPATTIPLGVLIGAGIIWVSSLMFFFASLFFRKKIFFDITHPMHWARRARHDLVRASGDDPELEMVNVNGDIRISVTGYMPDREDD